MTNDTKIEVQERPDRAHVKPSTRAELEAIGQMLDERDILAKIERLRELSQTLQRTRLPDDKRPAVAFEIAMIAADYEAAIYKIVATLQGLGARLEIKTVRKRP